VLIPLTPPDAVTRFVDVADLGKQPATMGEDGFWHPVKWGQGVADADWGRGCLAGANAGLRMGTVCDHGQFVFVDVDPVVDAVDGPLTAQAEAFSQAVVRLMSAHLGVALWVRQSRRGRAGILFRLPAAVDPGRKTVTAYVHDEKAIGKIEILTSGQQAAIGGVHVSGREMFWYRSDTGAVAAFPPVSELPQVASFEAVVAAVDHVTAALVGFGITGTRSKVRTAVQGSEGLVAPSGGVDDLCRLLEGLPHDHRVSRDQGFPNWIGICVAAVGATLALGLQPGSEDWNRVRGAVTNWSCKWTGPAGETTTWTEQAEKWDTDWSQRQPQSSWPQLAAAASALGDDSWRLADAGVDFLGVAGLAPMPRPEGWVAPPPQVAGRVTGSAEATSEGQPGIVDIPLGPENDATAREIVRVLARAGAIYLFNNILVDVEVQGGGRVRELRADHIPHLAAGICRTTKPTKAGEIAVTMPKDVRALAMTVPAAKCGVPLLEGLAAAPVLSADGGIRTATGYDPTSRLYALHVPVLGVPEAPTQDEAKTALAVLRAAFQTFPFADAVTVDDAARGVPVVDLEKLPGTAESCALVALMTAICRPSLPLAPGFMVASPAGSGSGAGKGLLVRTIAAIAFGCEPQAVNAGKSPEELDKRLGAALRRADPVFLLDNVNATALQSDTLASVLTESPAGIRIMGTSTIVALSTKTFIAVTGNGLTPSEDLVRRFIVCALDAKVESPSTRPFRDGEKKFRGGILARRGELLTAALTIWRWGRGQALKPGLPMGSYEAWSIWCRDPLLALGCKDPVALIADARASDPYRMRMEATFDAWWRAHGDAPVRATDVADPVAAMIDPTGRGRQSLASALNPLRGTRAGGFVLEVVPNSNARKEGTRYALHWVGEGDAPTRPEAKPSAPATRAAVDFLELIPGGLADMGRGRRAYA
jgi:hypothetical protein